MWWWVVVPRHVRAFCCASPCLPTVFVVILDHLPLTTSSGLTENCSVFELYLQTPHHEL